jgi:hypothetical protein
MADLDIPRPSHHTVKHRTRELCTFGCAFVGVKVRVNVREHMFELVFFCTSNRRCVVYKGVTKTQAYLEEPPAPFQPELFPIFQLYFQLEVGVGAGMIQDGTCRENFFTFFSLF